VKRLLGGRSISTGQAHHTLLPKTLAVAVLAPDPLSSVAYSVESMLFVLVGVSAATAERAGRWDETIRRLARLSSISIASSAPAGAVALIVRGETAALPLAGVIDFAAEKARLEKEMARVDSDIARIEAKLGNVDFLRRAPEEVVDGEREKREEAAGRRAKIKEALERLKGAA